MDKPAAEAEERGRWRRLTLMPLLGFASGLPLVLHRGTLQIWMKEAGVDLATLGLFSLLKAPYSFKFVWAPLLDRFSAGPWGRRRSWMLVAQVVIAAALAVLAFQDPSEAVTAVAAVAMVIAIGGATQDIVIDAYRTDVLRDGEVGPGVSAFLIGYRVAMIVAGAVALIMADTIGWQATYLAMAGLMLGNVAVTAWAPRAPADGEPPGTLREAIGRPFAAFLERHGVRTALSLLALVLLYRLGDIYASSLRGAFLIDLGFDKTTIGTVDKGIGLAAALGGFALAGVLMTRIDLYRSLLWFGVLQAASNLMFMALAAIGASTAFLAATAVVENVCAGLAQTALVALLTTLCDRRFSATQYALLSSVPALGALSMEWTSGFIAESVGWFTFYGFTALAALPGLVVLVALKSRVEGLERR